jgi:hypothetical protein
MTTIEGKGLVPPSVVRVQIDNTTLRHLQQIADQREKHRNYKNASGKWRRGSTANAILIGLVGEYAFQEFLRKRGIKAAVVDDRLNDGDGGRDAVIGSVSYQIKTSQRAYDTCLVRRVNQAKQIVPHVCDRFVFCRWAYGDEFCDLRGWCNRETILEKGRFQKGKKGGDWFNNEINVRHFESMANLVLLIKQESGNV